MIGVRRVITMGKEKFQQKETDYPRRHDGWAANERRNQETREWFEAMGEVFEWEKQIENLREQGKLGR